MRAGRARRNHHEGQHDRMKTLSPEPIEVDELVSYQNGSGVSNTIHKDAAGTITAFAFDAGESLSEHTGPVRRPGRWSPHRLSVGGPPAAD